MGNTPTGHKCNASESSESIDWSEVLKLDLEMESDGEEISPEPICLYCRHCEIEWEQDSWEEGGGYYQDWYCFAKDEYGEDVCFGNIISNPKDECPYFEKEEINEQVTEETPY